MIETEIEITSLRVLSPRGGEKLSISFHLLSGFSVFGGILL